MMHNTTSAPASDAETPFDPSRGPWRIVSTPVQATRGTACFCRVLIKL